MSVVWLSLAKSPPPLGAVASVGRTEVAHLPTAALGVGLPDPAASLLPERGSHYRGNCCYQCCWHLHRAHGYLDDKALPAGVAGAKNRGWQLQLWPILCSLACSSPQEPALLSVDSSPYLLGRTPSARDELEQNPTSSPYCCPIPPPIHPFPILVCHFPFPFYTHLSRQVTLFLLHSCLQPDDLDPVLTPSSKLTLPAPILDSQKSSPSRNHSPV